MCVDSIEMWHRRARPDPTDKDFNVQLGCHLEEIAEMLESLDFRSGMMSIYGVDQQAFVHITELATALKSGETEALVIDREDFLDSLADQIVTATGVGHCAGMKTSDAVTAVNASNWSKYDVNGHPLLDANGKIAKGPNYHKPVLQGLY